MRGRVICSDLSSGLIISGRYPKSTTENLIMLALVAAAPPSAAPPSSPAVPAAVLALLIVAALYFLSCLLWPWKKCTHCHDAKKLPGPFGVNHGFRMCPRCHGKGKEFRVGVRLWRGLFGHGWGRSN